MIFALSLFKKKKKKKEKLQIGFFMNILKDDIFF